MPLFTFRCVACDHTQEELCKFNERETYEGVCASCGDVVTYTGKPELIQNRDDFLKGKYGMKAVMSDGSKRKLGSGGTRGDC